MDEATLISRSRPSLTDFKLRPAQVGVGAHSHCTIFPRDASTLVWP